jgi:hypothetical protein
MRESVPGRPATYDPDEPRPPSEWQKMCADLEPVRQQLRNAPPPDELQLAAVMAEEKSRRRRDHRWHRARAELGG